MAHSGEARACVQSYTNRSNRPGVSEQSCPVSSEPIGCEESPIQRRRKLDDWNQMRVFIYRKWQIKIKFSLIRRFDILKQIQPKWKHIYPHCKVHCATKYTDHDDMILVMSLHITVFRGFKFWKKFGSGREQGLEPTAPELFRQQLRRLLVISENTLVNRG